ncbi:MAG: cytochrome c oxidase subunit II [Fibrobacterales bacterium]
MDYIQASSFAADIDNTFNIILGISLFFLVAITAFMIYAVIKYSRKNNPNPDNSHGSVPAEIIWTVIPTLLVILMFWYGYVDYKKMRDVPDDAMQIDVDSGMWWWKFTYPNGLEQMSKDGLTIPVNTPIYAPLHSVDVNHSFYIPQFRVKMDAIPKAVGEPLNYTWFEATMTGTFDLYCAEYCGINHSQMITKVHVLAKDEFDAWYAQAKVAKEAAAKSNPGETLYNSKGCIACHSTDGSSGVGPTMLGLYGKKREVTAGGSAKEVSANEEYLMRAILKPGAEVVKGFQPIMPPTIKDADEAKLIADYIKGLSSVSIKGEEAAPAPVKESIKEETQSKGSSEIDGAAVYSAKSCAACHSLNGTAGVGPSLKGIFGASRTLVKEGVEREITVDEAYVVKSIIDPNTDIVKGYKGMMPPTQISDAELKAVVAFLKKQK